MANPRRGEPSSFIGREAEIAALACAMASARVVALTGPGGTGKSRLARSAARYRAARAPSLLSRRWPRDDSAHTLASPLYPTE